MNRVLRKIMKYIAAAVLSLSAVLWGLLFMGALPSGAVGTAESAQITETEEDEESKLWEIHFRGMKITMQENGVAYIHESGCLNIRLEDAYLLQIDVEEDTVDDMWSGIDKKMEALTASGYRIEEKPTRLTEGAMDCVRYVISMENERGSAYQHTYSQVCLMPADSGRHFLVVIRYDGADVDAMGEEEKSALYDKGFADAAEILADACPTDEPDDAYGSYWMKEENISPGDPISDSIAYDDGTLTLSYGIPENCYLISDNIAGKTYLDEENEIYMNVSVINYTWESAKEKADKHSSAGFSRLHEQGETEVNGRVFYYYTYSVLERSKTKKRYHYYFYAYCDLDNGDIYAIYGNADNNPLAMDASFYLNLMDISE